jgi:hypothetical protein
MKIMQEVYGYRPNMDKGEKADSHTNRARYRIMSVKCGAERKAKTYVFYVCKHPFGIIA